MSETETTTGGQEAGWYADPGGSGALRWWAGTTWTDHLTPLPVQLAPLEQRASTERASGPVAPTAPSIGKWPPRTATMQLGTPSAHTWPIWLMASVAAAAVGARAGFTVLPSTNSPIVTRMLTNVTGIAASVGLDFDYDHVHQTNTVKAHELIHFAKAQGRQLDMKERLLKAYFVDGRHVGRIEDLADLAAEIGLDRDEVMRVLTDETYRAEVKADVAQAAAYGIQGVPFFVIDGTYGVSGAQDATTFANVLERARTEREAIN